MVSLDGLQMCPKDQFCLRKRRKWKLSAFMWCICSQEIIDTIHADAGVFSRMLLPGSGIRKDTSTKSSSPRIPSPWKKLQEARVSRSVLLPLLHRSAFLTILDWPSSNSLYCTYITMKVVAVFISLVSLAAAFAPQQGAGRASTQVNALFDDVRISLSWCSTANEAFVHHSSVDGLMQMCVSINFADKLSLAFL